MGSLCNKYVTQAILKAGLMYDYSDKALWGQIINELEHVSEEEVRREEEEDRRDMRLEEPEESQPESSLEERKPVDNDIVYKEDPKEAEREE